MNDLKLKAKYLTDLRCVFGGNAEEILKKNLYKQFYYSRDILF